MKVTIDKDICTGCGLCVDTCSDVFEMGDDTAIVKVKGDIQPDLEDSVKEAAENCPVEAIKIKE